MISRRLPAKSGPMASTFGRVGVRVEIDNDEGVLDGMQVDGLAVTVPKRRTVELHMHLS